MNILLIAANYTPEIGSSAQIYHDLAGGFAKYGHNIHVLTSYPRDYTLTDDEKVREIPLDSNEDGVMVHRVRPPSKRDSAILRGLEHFYIPFYYFQKYKGIRESYGIKFDACIFHIPPLPFHYLAQMIKRYDGTPSVFNMQDYHPQELTDVGFLKNPLAIAVLKHIERKAYQKTDALVATSPGGVTYMIERGASASKISIVFNPVNLSVIDNPYIIGNFKDLYGIRDKSLVVYAGILSPFQGLDVILDVAKRLSNRSEILFYIVGDGMEKERLESRVISENITNVRIHPLMPRNEYVNLIHSTDVALISLDERMKAPCFPGKTLNLMGMSKAILALTALDSEIATTVSHAGCGIAKSPKDIEGICDAILQMVDDAELRLKFGQAGRQFFMENMDIAVVIKRYENIVAGLHTRNEEQ